MQSNARVRTLVIATLCLSAPSVAVAEDKDAEPQAEVKGETIVVTGLRLPRPVEDVPAAVTVVDRAEIEHSPARLTDDLLRSLPSLGTFRRSSSLIADPTSQGVSLRGVGSSAVSRGLVLRDGIPVNDPFGGWVYWRAMSPLDIQQIEVSPSGASALFGDFALGGVVQMLSRPIEKREAQAVLAGGTYGTGRASVRVADKLGDIGVGIDGEAFHSGGYTPIAPYARGSVDERAASTHGTAGVRVEHVRGGSTTHITARWFQETLDAGTQFTTADVRTVNLGAGYKLQRENGDALQIELFGGDQLFRQQRARVNGDRSMAFLASKQKTPSRNQGAFVTYATSIARIHQLLVGADARRVTGTATDELFPATTMDTSLVGRSAGGEQRFAGAFVEDTFPLTEDIDVAGAVRVDGWQNRAGQLDLTRGNGDQMNTALAETSRVQLDPRIGVIGHVSDQLALRASTYRAFRAPTLNELYRPFQVGTVLTAANENLRPETLWGAELGPQITVSNIVVRATGFYNRLDDAIGNVTAAEMRPDGAQRVRMNFGTARIAGLELDASWHPAPAWTLLVAHTFSDATVVQAPDAPMLVGKRLAHDPRHRSTASVTYDDPRIAAVTVQVRYLGTTFEDDLNTQPIGAVGLVDARIARRIGHGLAAFVAGENLADRRYLVGRAGIDTFGAPRTLEAGILLDTH